MDIPRAWVRVEGTRTVDRKTVQKFHVRYHDDGTVSLEKNTWWDWYRRHADVFDTERVDPIRISDDRVRDTV